MEYEQMRKFVVAAGKRLINENLVQGTWGNISVRLDDSHMLITPSGMDYDRMKESDLVVMDINTMEYEGEIKPSSEKDVHAGIYRGRKEITAVIHSHPSYCCSVAATRKEVPVQSEEMQAVLGGSMKVAKYALPSTKKLSDGVMTAIEGRNGCLMANHGVVVCGKTIEEAFEVIRVMEQSCKKLIEDAVKSATGAAYSDDAMLELFKKSR